jgi:hypothetical protein
MVRASKLESTASGTYFNLSPGIIDSIDVVAGVEPGSHGNSFETIPIETSPNPFSTGTIITFRMTNPARTVLEIHDISGRLVRMIDAGQRPPGEHSLRWDGSDADGHKVASGIYFVSIRTGTVVQSSKMVRVK